MTVLILSLSARGSEEIAVTFEMREGEYTQRDTLLVPLSLVADLGLRTGECDQSCYDALSRGAELCRAVKKGLSLLGYGSCSARALCRKLTAKGFSREISAEAVRELTEKGYLNDGNGALREAERCVEKLWGKRRIAAALYAKGYDREAVRDALDCLEEQGVEYADLCAERIRSQVGVVPSEPVAHRKLIASLERYGFSSSDIREAFRILSE